IPSGRAATAERLVVAVVAILALMLWLMVPVLRWRTTTYELTTRRLRMRDGIVTRHGRDIPLARINDISFEKGPLDRLLGSGRLVVESAGEHGQILLRDIPRAEFVQATLFRLVEEEQRRLERNERNQPGAASLPAYGNDQGVAAPRRRGGRDHAQPPGRDELDQLRAGGPAHPGLRRAGRGS